MNLGRRKSSIGFLQLLEPFGLFDLQARRIPCASGTMPAARRFCTEM
jgi:hypothetical protein